MIELAAFSGLANVGLLVCVVLSMRWAREERESLLDRIMALSKPEALITKQALEDDTPAAIDYVDESKEFALGNSNVDLLGDD